MQSCINNFAIKFINYAIITGEDGVTPENNQIINFQESG